MLDWLRRKLLEFLALSVDAGPRLVFDGWSVVELGPGDVIVLSTEQVIGKPLLDRLKEEFKANLPGHMQNHKILVLMGGLKLNVIKEIKND